MRFVLFTTLFGALTMFAQSDRGTITGTVSDPTGAVIANAPIVARNIQTGVATTVASSETGNYTIPSLSSGDYEVKVSLSAFKEYIRTGLAVQAAQTIRIDVQLEIGNLSESVTVTDAAPLLKTESGEMSHVVSIQRMDSLPVLQTGGNAGSGGIRNPIVVVALIPGSALTVGQTGPTVRINGGVNNSQTMLVEGMDASNSLGQGASQQNQVPTDAVQEFAIQTSNYAAEFGQAGSAIMNITLKSGTNQYHGSGYLYWVNEKLNAGQPMLNALNTNAANIANGNPRPKTRRNDYGFTFGGPVVVPGVYDGRNRSFFFLNWEQYRAGNNVIANAISVPTAAYRGGNFSSALLGTNLGTDPLGNPIRPNMIYDPLTRQTAANGSVVTSQFPGNALPAARLDPVALKVQALIPNPTSSNLVVNNFQGGYIQERITKVPSLKIDQVINSKNRFSLSGNQTTTNCDFCAGAEGLPLPVTAAIGTNIRAHTERLNWDTTITPTLLFHWGLGFTQNWLGRPALADGIDATSTLGLRGPFTGRGRTFPQFTGLSNAQGGSSNISSTGALADDVFQQVGATVSLTWVKNNHTFKYGGELRNQGNYRLDSSGINGTYGFGPQQTAMPYVVAANANAQVAGNTIGFPYASFLLGLVNNGNVKPGSRARIGKAQWGFYAQDTWKVTRKLTLDYGLRYDYSTYLKEQHGRMANFAADLANPTAGGHPGAVQYEATCNCSFANNYKLGFGPRVGVAYQLNGKSVLRAGFGVVYTGTSQYNLAGGAISASNPFGPNSDPGREVMTLGTGLPLTNAQIAWPNFSPGYYPVPPNLVGPGPGSVIDQNSGRPGRQFQWSIGVQREINRNLVVDLAYVGNRQAWLTNGGLVNYNFLSTARLQAYGLNPALAADQTILNSNVTAAGAGRFRNQVPFAGFTGTVAQSLRPFPQFNGGLGAMWAPIGNAWYDGLQLKVTQRFSHGFEFGFNFTYSKEIDTLSSGTFDVENRKLFKTLSSNSRPLISGFNVNYTVPTWDTNRLVSYALRDWTIGGFFQYASGTPFTPPVATTNPALGNLTFQSTYQYRVPGQPLFTTDLDCHCFDPNTTFVLNPNAWANPAAGQYGGATFYNDFRRQRHPFENIAFGRDFRVTEKVRLNVRAEFTNMFNRAYINDPTSANPAAVQTRLAGTSQTTAGYGFINNSALNQGTFATGGGQPRQGQMVARFTF